MLSGIFSALSTFPCKLCDAWYFLSGARNRCVVSIMYVQYVYMVCYHTFRTGSVYVWQVTNNVQIRECRMHPRLQTIWTRHENFKFVSKPMSSGGGVLSGCSVNCPRRVNSENSVWYVQHLHIATRVFSCIIGVYFFIFLDSLLQKQDKNSQF